MTGDFSEHYILEELNVEGSALSAQIGLPENLLYFDGHFDEIKVLPGVVQLHWAINLACENLGISGTFGGVDSMKFMRLIQPKQIVRLNIQYDAEKNVIDFTYRDEGQKLSMGKVKFV